MVWRLLLSSRLHFPMRHRAWPAICRQEIDPAKARAYNSPFAESRVGGSIQPIFFGFAKVSSRFATEKNGKTARQVRSTGKA
jgi:hypothetical protein